MNNTSNDVKQLLARVSFHLAKTVPQEKMATDLLKLLIPTLVNGTKEKNVYVKANSEIALIAVLRLKDGDVMFQVLNRYLLLLYINLTIFIILSEMFGYFGRRSERIVVRCCK